VGVGKAIETIAEEMRQALKTDGFFALLRAAGNHVDQTMNMVHVPANQIDGDMTKEEVFNMYADAEAMYTKTAPNGVLVDGPVTVDGDVITTDLTMTTTLSNGEPHTGHSISQWTVKDGYVVSCYAVSQAVEGSGHQQILKMMEERGLETPARRSG
jgi:hypothetical protein